VRQFLRPRLERHERLVELLETLPLDA